MERTKQNESVRETQSVGDSASNSMNIEDQGRARQKILNSVASDEDVVDIQESSSYSTATRIREQFRKFL